MTKYENELGTTEAEVAEQIVELETRAFGAISLDYIRRIAESIAADVIREIWESADRSYWCDDDLRLAVGRVLCDRLGLDA